GFCPPRLASRAVRGLPAVPLDRAQQRGTGPGMAAEALILRTALVCEAAHGGPEVGVPRGRKRSSAAAENRPPNWRSARMRRAATTPTKGSHARGTRQEVRGGHCSRGCAGDEGLPTEA